MKIKLSDITAENVSGRGVFVMALVDGRLRRGRYYGFSKKQAKSLFRAEILQELGPRS